MARAWLATWAVVAACGGAAVEVPVGQDAGRDAPTPRQDAPGRVDRADAGEGGEDAPTGRQDAPGGSFDVLAEAPVAFDEGGREDTRGYEGGREDTGVDAPGDVDRRDVPCPYPGQTRCGGVCLDLLTNGDNCGACGNQCGRLLLNSSCIGGNCKCAPGLGNKDCGAEGCVYTDIDPLNCGGCGHECVAGAVCSSGVCVEG
jgi:hypothetical protein